ncbi:MAG: NADH-quinone oxidoreductase subunit J [Gammaproteobacteria bacterium]|nr:NADH-quinone oxidoreductase subunit J [Gammaproteobacteria bacterium]
MAIEPVIFYFFAVVLVATSVAVITVPNSVHAVLFLVLAFFTSAGLWLLLEAEFLAITLVLVYVGAVMVLFLFVVMMLDINFEPTREGFIKNLPIGIIVALIMVVEIILVVWPNFGLENYAAPAQQIAGYSNTKELGLVLYTVYLYAFELAAAILLLAIVAAIMLTLRRRPNSKYQDISEQVLAKKKDRLRIVKMESSPKAAPTSVQESEGGVEQ